MGKPSLMHCLQNSRSYSKPIWCQVTSGLDHEITLGILAHIVKTSLLSWRSLDWFFATPDLLRWKPISELESFLASKMHTARCLKITEKVSFNIASEASYVYILSGQKLIKNAKKMVHFGEFLKTWSLRSNSVTRQVSFNRTKIGGKCQNWKIKMRHFE